MCCLCLCNLRNSALELTLQNFVNLCNQRPPEGIKMHQIRFAPELRPGPRWGSSRRSSRPPSRMGRGKPPPIPLPLDAFGVSIPAPSAPVALPPTYFSFPRAWVWFLGRVCETPSPPAGGSGVRCKFPQRGPGQSPDANTYFCTAQPIDDHCMATIFASDLLCIW